MKSSKSIFFISYGGGHLNILLPIYNLLKKSNFNLKIFALTSAINQCKSLKIPFESYKNYISDNELKKYKDQILENHDDSFDIVDTIAYIGKNLEELNNLWGHQSIKKYKLKKRHSFYPYEFMKKVIKKNKPDLVISTNSPKSEFAALIAAKSLGIKTLQIDDLNGESFVSLVSDIVCANTHLSIPNIISKGVNPENIYVTGNPAFDKYSIIQKNKTNEDVVVFLSQTGLKNTINDEFLFFSENFLKTFLNDLNKKVINMNKKLLIRLHPNDNVDNYNKISNDLSFKINYDNSESFFESMSRFSNFISFNSTSLMEAYLFNKNIVELKINDKFESLELSNNAFSKVNINGNISSLNFFKSKAKIDGNNTKRVIDLINKLI